MVVTQDVDDLPPDSRVELREVRFRVPWPETGRYLCLGNEHDRALTTAGCSRADVETPATVTLESAIGGLRLES